MRPPKLRRTGPATWQSTGRLRFHGLVGVEEHVTSLGPGGGCFPLCEGCWSRLTPDERLPFYWQLGQLWGRDLRSDDERAEHAAKWPAMALAVLEGR